ncbi:MAG TPA: carbonic anhydrase [Candidatus Binataceae bacterium]|nr:carbonic anhydrase [Candidatus Binataceae bacterium]
MGERRNQRIGRPQRMLLAGVLGSVLSLALLIGIVSRALPATPAGPSVAPDKALQQLLDGNQRYVSNAARHPDQRPSADDQHPIATILSCSDSRVPPEIIFDQGVGTIFVSRVAGNTYNSLVLESLAYSVTNLGVRLIVVMGHDQCGAVKAAINAYPERMAGTMLKNIYPAVRAAKGMNGDLLSNAIDANAELIAKKLATEPPFARLVESGQLRIIAARYALASGRVTILSERERTGKLAE